jgi:hypothetical protein
MDKMSDYCANCGAYTYSNHKYGGCCSQKCYDEHMKKKHMVHHMREVSIDIDEEKEE